MFDVVGLIASIITIAQIVIKSVEYARTFYRAHEEFKALQASITLGAPMLLFLPKSANPFLCSLDFSRVVRDLQCEYTIPAKSLRKSFRHYRNNSSTLPAW